MTDTSRPLSAIQRNLLELAPEHWESARNFNMRGPTMKQLISRNLVEVTRQGLWRRKPMDFRAAVQRLIDRLPSTDRAIDAHVAGPEIREVRRMLAEGTP